MLFNHEVRAVVRPVVPGLHVLNLPIHQVFKGLDQLIHWRGHGIGLVVDGGAKRLQGQLSVSVLAALAIDHHTDAARLVRDTNAVGSDWREPAKLLEHNVNSDVLRVQVW